MSHPARVRHAKYQERRQKLITKFGLWKGQVKIESDLIECATGKWQVEISWGAWTAYTKPMPRKEDAVKESNKLMDILRESLRRPNSTASTNTAGNLGR